jgi:hypothetical protein
VRSFRVFVLFRLGSVSIRPKEKIMSCISSSARAAALARIAKNKELLAKTEAALEKALEVGAESYAFDSGEGSQRTKYRKLSEIEDLRSRLEASIAHDENFLSGAGVVSLNVRRAQGWIRAHR